MEKGNYCVAAIKTNAGKPQHFLFKVSSISKGIVEGVVEKDCHISSLRTTIEVPVKNVLVDLGTDPKPGKVYGCDVSNLYRGKKIHEEFGTVHWFYKPEAETGSNLMKAFDKVTKTLRHNKLDFIVDPASCIWEALPYNGEKYAGLYMRSNAPDKKPHRFQIRPEIMPTTDYPYVIHHELAHHLHKEYVTSKKLNATWIRLFNTSIKLVSIRKEKSVELLEALLAQEDLPSDFRSNLSEEDTLIYKWILRTIGQHHSLSVKELDTLFSADYKDDIKEVWPMRTIQKKDLAPVVSEYATRNVNELLAEAVSHHLCGKSLPTRVTSLVEKTFSYARSNHEKR